MMLTSCHQVLTCCFFVANPKGSISQLPPARTMLPTSRKWLHGFFWCGPRGGNPVEPLEGDPPLASKDEIVGSKGSISKGWCLGQALGQVLTNGVYPQHQSNISTLWWSNIAGKSIVDGLPIGHGPFPLVCLAGAPTQFLASICVDSPGGLAQSWWDHRPFGHMNITSSCTCWSTCCCSAIIYRNLYHSDIILLTNQQSGESSLLRFFVASRIIGGMPHVATSLMNHPLFSASLIWVMNIVYRYGQMCLCVCDKFQCMLLMTSLGCFIGVDLSVDC